MTVEVEDIIEQPSEEQKRINQLSKKISVATEERDAEKAAREAAEAKTAEATRERDFYVGYADVVSTHPAAKDHKDEILAKVKSGYTVEDATFAILGKAGKLSQPTVERQPITGGSAATSLPSGGTKSVSEMTRDEKYAALKEAEARGDISLT